MYVHGELLFPDYVALGLLACTLGFLLSIIMYAWWEWWRSEREGKPYLLIPSKKVGSCIEKVNRVFELASYHCHSSCCNLEELMEEIKEEN